jgi:hypothetical protein
MRRFHTVQNDAVRISPESVHHNVLTIGTSD